MSKDETNKGSKEQKDQNAGVDDLPIEQSEADQVKGGRTGNTYAGLTQVDGGIVI
jgi:hypothetical protein